MTEQDPRVRTMFGRDRAAAWIAVALVWATYAFVFWRMTDAFAATGLTAVMAALASVVLFLNTAAVLALLRHYEEDKAAIYGADIYYLDRIAAERRAAR